MDESLWRPPPAALTLSARDVHVWRVPLAARSAEIERLLGILAEDELRRAERMIVRAAREHFIVARGRLRLLLGRYLERSPGEIGLRYSRFGKPALATPAGGGELRFNVAHSGGLALYAFTLGREIGVDLELVRTDFAWEEIAGRYFSPHENQTLQALPVEARYRAFFACWTRKEAYLKARGEGLSVPLHQFDVSVAVDEPAALLRTWDDPEEAARWSLQTLDPGPEYAAALAVERGAWEIARWAWAGTASSLLSA